MHISFFLSLERARGPFFGGWNVRDDFRDNIARVKRTRARVAWNEARDIKTRTG